MEGDQIVEPGALCSLENVLKGVCVQAYAAESRLHSTSLFSDEREVDRLGFHISE